MIFRRLQRTLIWTDNFSPCVSGEISSLAGTVSFHLRVEQRGERSVVLYLECFQNRAKSLRV